jgi:hypothetical protein
MRRSAKWLIVLVLILSASAAVAQDKKFEFKVFWGYTVSPSLDIQPVVVPGDAVVDKLSPRSSFSYGLQLDYFFAKNFSAGFLFDPQMTQLYAHATVPTTAPNSTIPGVPGSFAFADMVTYNYHGVVTYHFGKTDNWMRPFVFAGPGITRYSPSELIVYQSGYLGARNVDGVNKFSTTMGGGIKAYISPRFGFLGMMRYTPTHIGDSSSGIWCSPYWGCFDLSNAQWSHQIEFTAGLIFRF